MLYEINKPLADFRFKKEKEKHKSNFMRFKKDLLVKSQKASVLPMIPKIFLFEKFIKKNLICI